MIKKTKTKAIPNVAKGLDGYTFVEEGHRHLFNGKRMAGVTTVLGVIGKPALLGWTANTCADYILANGKEMNDECILVTKAVVNEARTAHIKSKNSAGSIGTIVHKAIENYLKNGIIPELDDQQMVMFNHFVVWYQGVNAKLIESEKHVYSEKMFVGGILDMVVEIDGQNWIADIKTGGVYPEAFAQMAAYSLMLKEMGYDLPITGVIILGLLKDGTFIEKRSVSMEDAEKMFLAALDIYRIQNKLNQLT